MDGSNNRIMLSVNNVIKWRRYEKMAVDKISFNVYEGGHTLLYGTSGSGIYELWKIITGLERQESGNVGIFSEVSIIPEKFPYIENMRVFDYIILACMFGEISSREVKAHARLWLKNSALERQSCTKIEFLSHYEKCELLLIMAAIKKAEILLVGNCMSLMNDEQNKRFWEQIKIFAKKYEMTVICFSEDQNLLFPFKNVYRVENGKIRHEK